MESPKVLVVMPLYNARPFVRKAINSILAQTYKNFQLLIINDGSTDGSEQDAASFQDDRVMLWQQTNQGPGAAMNRATHYALEQGIPFLARIDSDDIALPLRFETQIRLLEKYPAAAACSANCHYIDAESEQIIGSTTVSASPALIRWEIVHGLRGLIQGASLFRSKALSSIGGYRPQFKLAEEADVFLRLTELYELRNSSEFLCKVRIRPGSLSLQNVRMNILYQFYALDCAKNRNRNKPERDFDTFHQTMPWDTKFRVWREDHFLKLWRNHMQRGSVFSLLFASLLDPRRVMIRCLRKLNDQKQIK